MKEETLFHDARQKPRGERTAFLEEACAGNVALRERVEILLQADDHPDSLLEPKPPATTTMPSLTEHPGTVIGPYKLLQQIGEGGMGVVFMAEQTEPIQRTVALKIIKPGMDTRQVIARFEAERQALAMMDHPNIAKVLDAGTTDTGRPYFVMELVKGVPITDYCDQQHLSIRARLKLMSTVCHAIQHAHQKGIIHRDLKPSNVLVAEYDGRPVPKIIDFGVAKATAQRLTEKTMFTEYGQLIGTFEYMSPEQARFNQLDVDTCSDIYSLGVLLYEVLAGSTPLGKERLRSAAFDEVLRIICEEEPPRPSLRLNSSQALPSISAQRQIEPAKLKKLVQGELDWIVMKCLEKDRSRRYETASALAVDLQRYLADEPVLARPTTRKYRLKKFIRRNKAVLLATTVVTIALIGGAVVSAWQAIRARRAEVQAKANAGQAEQVASFLVGAFRSPDPERDGRTITIAEVLDRAARGLNDDFADDSRAQAALLKAIGDSYVGLGLFREASPILEKAHDLRVQTLGSDHIDTLAAMKSLVIAYRKAGQLRESVPLHEELRRLVISTLGPDHPETLSAMDNLAVALLRTGRHDEALPLCEETLRRAKLRLGPNDAVTLSAMDTLAWAYQLNGGVDKAVSLYENVLNLKRIQLGLNHPSTLDSMNSLATAYRDAGRTDEARGLFEETIILEKAKLGPDHPDTLRAIANLAQLNEIDEPVRINQPDESQPSTEKSAAGDQSPNTNNRKPDSAPNPKP